MPASRRPITPGFRFKDGRLMIFQTGGEFEVTLIRGWEEPLATQKPHEGPWENFTPEFRLVAPYRPRRKKAAPKKPDVLESDSPQLGFDFGDWTPEPKPPPRAPAAKPADDLATQKRRAFDSFRFSLPREVAAVLEPFRSHQWPLLDLIWRERRALDLAKSNPLLAQAAAHWRHAHPMTPLKIGSLKQRDLLFLLKLPDTKAVARILSKVPPESYDPAIWDVLAAALRRPDESVFQLLSHAPAINRGVIDLALRAGVRERVTPVLIEEAAARPAERYRGALADEIAMLLAMADHGGEALAGMVPVRFTSSTQIRQIHDNVLEAYRKLSFAEGNDANLPPPPLPGVPGKIEPILTVRQLHTEGRVQHNCVGCYTEAVRRRECFIYRVLEPQRCTLAVRRSPYGEWKIQELKAACNAEPAEETLRAVRDWLEPYRLGI